MKSVAVRWLYTSIYLLITFAVFTGCSKRGAITDASPSPETGTKTEEPQVTTFAGTTDNHDWTGKIYAQDIARDKAGNIYISDSFRDVIFKMNPAGKVTLFAGSYDKWGYADGTGTEARFFYQQGIVTDSKGNVFVTDYSNYRIRKITPEGVVTTLAGNEKREIIDGQGTQASFASPVSITIDKNDNLYVKDNFTTIRKITPDGTVSTFYKGMPSIGGFSHITITKSDDFYITDNDRNCVYKLSKDGVFSVFAGSGQAQTRDGIGTAAAINRPGCITTDEEGNIYVSERGAISYIRKITPDAVVTTLAGTGINGWEDGSTSEAKISSASGLATDEEGNIYFSELGNVSIRKITKNKQVTTVFGVAKPVNGQALTATFGRPVAIVMDAAKNLYVADAAQHLIRKITPAGVVSTYAGSGKPGLVNGSADKAQFNCPVGLAIDASGNLFVADSLNSALRKISADGVVSTIPWSYYSTEKFLGGVAVAANGDLFFSDSYTGNVCRLSGGNVRSYSSSAYHSWNGRSYHKPRGLAIDVSGSLYLADTYNSRVCRISADGPGVVIGGSTFESNYPKEGSNDGKSTSAGFNYPQGVTVDKNKNVYVADTYNNLIRKITPAGDVTTIAGMLTRGYQNGALRSAQFSNPQALVVDPDGTVLYIVDTNNRVIRKVKLQ